MARKAGFWRISGTVFVIATAVNYPWELLQSRLYVAKTDGMSKWLHCFIASLGDALLVLLMLGMGWAIFGRRDWFTRASLRGFILILGLGLLIGTGLEWVDVHILAKWSYKPTMPIVPGLDIGLVPILQMLILPPLIFWLGTQWLSRGLPKAIKA